jgi:P27 family predicted phage terminase small subunit
VGRRGPAPKPTALRLIQGNPGRLPLNPKEPEPAIATLSLEPPKWLTKTALEAWHRLLPDLIAVNILTKVDVDVFAAYCATYARWREAEEYITANGLLMYIRGEPEEDEKTGKLKKGSVKYIQQIPHVAIAQKALLMLCKLGAELGLTPASRTRIHIETPATPEQATARRIFGS